MVARLPLLFVLGSLGLACGADPAPEPMTQDKRVEIAPPQGASDAATTPPKPKKTAAEHHRDFMGGCTRRSGTSADYCECAWGEFRKELTDEDMDGTELDRTKVDHVKAQVLTACASFVSEDMVRADFAKACRGGKGELEPYCDCTWTELRKKFSPAELNDETTVESDRFKTTRAAVTGPLTASVADSTGGPKQVANEAVVGTIKGTVKLDGNPPPPTALNLGTCTPENTGPIFSESAQVKDGKLQNAFVWVKKGLESYVSGAPPAQPIVMDQHGCLYHPHVIGAQVGQKVVFLNSDLVPHNVRSIVEANAPFNDMMPTKGMRVEKTFGAPEIMVRAKCDYHPWMAAFVGVVPHPFFAVTNDAGEFTLVNVPEGDLELEAWTESFGKQTQKVKVEARKTATTSFTFRAE